MSEQLFDLTQFAGKNEYSKGVLVGNWFEQDHVSNSKAEKVVCAFHFQDVSMSRVFQRLTVSAMSFSAVWIKCIKGKVRVDPAR
jgi:hypothetical protein